MQKSVILLSVTLVVLASLAVLPRVAHGFEINAGQLERFQAVSKIVSPKQIIEMGDANNDGRLSIAESIKFASKYGIKLHKHQLAPFDLNNDGYFSVDEIEAVSNGGD